MITCEMIEEIERKNLKPYACFSESAIRKRHTLKPKTRSEFQRDRDRIIYSKAFRRLEYKTQVYLTQVGDHLRTRLTHSLEVAQISRSICAQLSLNQDLAEAIALGHDLGHTPFGHAGEQALKEILKEKNRSFKHNVQSVRVIDCLETKYSYAGLNLTLPVREGILKHTSFPDDLGDDYSDLFLNYPFSVTLEGQVVAIADEIAQATHDFDDYLRYNIVDYGVLSQHKMFEYVNQFYIAEYGNDLVKKLSKYNDDTIRKDVFIRCLVDYLITLLVRESEINISKGNPKAYELDREYIKYSEEVSKVLKDFKKFFWGRLMADCRVREMDLRGKYIINRLFETYETDPLRMPTATFKKYDNSKEEEKIIVIVDHIAGMTDRYAIERYDELCKVYVR